MSGSLQAKVLDFGLARRSASAYVTGETLTRTPDLLANDDRFVGTLPYMAPEQFDGRPIDARSDLFAFGALVYEMVAGRRPFEAKSQASLIAAILDRDPEPLATVQPSIPRGLDRLVRKCLAKDPEARWQSAVDVADELRWLTSNTEAGSSGKSDNRPLQRRHDRSTQPWQARRWSVRSTSPGRRVSRLLSRCSRSRSGCASGLLHPW